MYKIIGFIPQISQGLFSFGDKYFAINPPFKQFTTIQISEAEISRLSSYVEDQAYFEELDHVYKHFERVHLLEMLSNKNLIDTLNNRIQEIEHEQNKSLEKSKKAAQKYKENLSKVISENAALKSLIKGSVKSQTQVAKIGKGVRLVVERNKVKIIKTRDEKIRDQIEERMRRAKRSQSNISKKRRKID